MPREAKSGGHVLIVSHERVGSNMAGPGVRYYHLARVLAREFEVILAVPLDDQVEVSDEVVIMTYQSGQDSDWEDLIRGARAIVVPAVWLALVPDLLASDIPLVVDGYDPIIAELLCLQPAGAEAVQARLTQAHLAGDFFICASERQRDWWLGVLEATGRINIHTYGDDPTIRRLVDVVPYGLPEAPPRHSRAVVKGVWPGITRADRVILWGGGLWPWLDPLTAIRAVAQVWQVRQDVRLIFPGTQHPNPAMAGIPTHTAAARALASQLGLLDRAIWFGEWVQYDEWPNVLLESDVALTLHGADTLEARLAFRSRVLDCIWAGLPVVATQGDVMSELIAQYDLGFVVEGGAVDAVATAILRLLDVPREIFASRCELLRPALTWESVARPLLEFCRQPRRAPDKLAAGYGPGNPYYARQVAELRHTVDLFEQMKFIRLVRWLHPYRQKLRALFSR